LDDLDELVLAGLLVEVVKDCKGALKIITVFVGVEKFVRVLAAELCLAF
jgi:hypothetical protein